MDLIQANVMVDTLLNTAHDLRNLAAEEANPRMRKWLESKSATLVRDALEVIALEVVALEVVALPMVGFVMPLAPALDASGE